ALQALFDLLVRCRCSEVDDPYLEYAPKQFYIKMVFINSSRGRRPRNKEQDAQAESGWPLTLYAGAKSPGKDKESNWLPAPQGHFSLYLRAYWADRPILDGTWEPPVITSVQGMATRTEDR